MRIWEYPFFCIGRAIDWTLVNPNRFHTLATIYCLFWLFCIQPLWTVIGVGTAGTLLASIHIFNKYQNE